MQNNAPVFIGGTNGSGTRVYAQLLEAAGVFQGEDKNTAFEPQKIIQYTRPLVPTLMEQTGGAIYSLDTLPAADRIATETWLQDFANAVQIEMPTTYHRWGWKHPRNMFLAPFLHAMFQGCFFIHVIRDGRDMGLAGNKGDFLTMNQRFGGDFEDTPSGAAGFWSRVNTEVSDWCTAQFGTRYVYSRFEDMCANPETECRRILSAVGLEYTASVAAMCADFVKKPATVGRWHSLEKTEQVSVTLAATPGLQRFGYLD
jgi:hypothetical protein